jgi:hypothetical protein
VSSEIGDTFVTKGTYMPSPPLSSPLGEKAFLTYAREILRARRLLSRAALVLVLVALAIPAVTIARYKWFPSHFDVQSIALTPQYQDASLLSEAWMLPVAARYQHRVDFQPNGSLCGPTSAANVFRSLGEQPSTADGVLDGSGVCPFGFCWQGLSLDQLAMVITGKTRHHVTLLRDLSLPEFREHLARSNDPTRRYIVNFHRGLLFSRGGGHHSPIGGYLADRDLVFVLDVNESFKPWLVSSERLFRAVDQIDSSSKKKRGLLLVE